MNKQKSGKTTQNNQSTSLKMSKLDRIAQTKKAQTNWREMAKILFVTDENQRSSLELSEGSSHEQLLNGGFNHKGSSSAPFHDLLMLIVIVSVAEKRTQELYEAEFSERCDGISVAHDLRDDHYWPAGKVPVAYEDLNLEFERKSNQILIETLREYDQHEMADRVVKDGPEKIFDIIQQIKIRYLEAIKNCSTAGKDYFGA